MTRRRIGRWAAGSWMGAVMLLSAGVAWGQTASTLQSDLVKAILAGKPADVRSALEHGADANQPLPGSDGINPVITAAYKKQLEALNILMAAGGRPDDRDVKGWTALLWAAREGFSDGVGALLDKGANVNARAKDGATALILACYRGHVKAVAILLRGGADVQIKDARGLTARDTIPAGARAAVLEVLDAAAIGGAVTVDGERFSFTR